MTDAASSAGDPLAHVPEGPVPSSQEGRRLLDLVRVGVPAIRAVVKSGRVVVEDGRLK